MGELSYTPFSPVERLAFDNRKASAEILLAPVEQGFTWATSCQRRHGNFSGYAEPLGQWSDQPPRRRAATRLAAIKDASDRIRRHDADREVLAWLDTLIPAQRDLFQGSDQ